MAKFHLRFKQFKPGTLEATDALFAARPWRVDEEGAVALGQTWLDAVCATYELPPVRLEVGTPGRTLARSSSRRQTSGDPLAYAPGEEDVPNEDESELLRRPALRVPPQTQRGGSRFSVFQLFKHFRIYMLDNGVQRANDRRSKKDDVHGWACSLFYRVRPIMFRARVRQGRIKRIHPDELLARETLDSRRAVSRGERVAEVRQEIAQESGEAHPHHAALALHSQVAGSAIASLNTRPLRRYASKLGMANTWSRDKESIMHELLTSDEMVKKAQDLLASTEGETALAH